MPAQPTQRQQHPETASSADPIILEMLNNIKANGFDADPAINNGLGGLWINWRYRTNPLQTNFNGSGQPDGASVHPPRHDPLTDLRYLHTLWMYKSVHPTDTQFDSEITRYTAIVKLEFANPQDERGWLYDEFIDLYSLSKDTFYQQSAQSLANYLATTLYQPAIGTVYKTNSSAPSGYYRVDLALESGCALIQAGTIFNHPEWVSAGQKTVQFVYAHAYIPAYHTFVFQMGNVLLPNGTANPHEVIYRGTYGNTKIEGGSIKLGEAAQEILSLLHVYIVTHDQTFLSYATDLLAPLTAQNNALGLWDAQQSGYFADVVFPGPDVNNPGPPQVNIKAKESGRQLQMLETFRVANSLTQNRYQDMQDSLLQVAINKIYYAPGHGVLFEETSDWQPLTLKNGGRQDWVTTEAMGITLEGVLSLEENNPW